MHCSVNDRAIRIEMSEMLIKNTCIDMAQILLRRHRKPTLSAGMNPDTLIPMNVIVLALQHVSS